MNRFFSSAEDPVSCGTHAIGAIAAFLGGVIYLFRAVAEEVPVITLAAAMCFCLSMIALYAASAVYHYYPGDYVLNAVKRRLRSATSSALRTAPTGRLHP